MLKEPLPGQSRLLTTALLFSPAFISNSDDQLQSRSPFQNQEGSSFGKQKWAQVMWSPRTTYFPFRETSFSCIIELLLLWKNIQRQRKECGRCQADVHSDKLSILEYLQLEQINNTQRAEGNVKQTVSYVDTCSCRRPGPEIRFLFHERSSDLVFPNQHGAEHLWACKDGKKYQSPFGTNRFLTTLGSIIVINLFPFSKFARILKYTNLKKIKSHLKNFVLGYFLATALFCEQLLTNYVLEQIFSQKTSKHLGKRFDGSKSSV